MLQGGFSFLNTYRKEQNRKTERSISTQGCSALSPSLMGDLNSPNLGENPKKVLTGAHTPGRRTRSREAPAW